TFYNSVACAVLHRRHYHNEFIFWRPAVATEHLEGESPTYRCYYPPRDGLRKTLRAIAGSFGLTNPWEDLHRDLLSTVRALRARLLPRRHGGARSLRIVPALADAEKAACRALHGRRLGEAGQDALLPRPALPPQALDRPLRRRTRHQGHGDAGVHAAVVSLCL